MVCLTCNGQDVVENQALGKTFYYCRTCKDECFLNPVTVEQDIDEFFRWLASSDAAAHLLPPPDDTI